MPSWWCGPTYNEWFCGVLSSSASCARSITQCWWSALGLLVWSIAIVSWLAFQSTWSDDSSQCWTRLRSWPIICGNPTTSPTRWPASIVCTSLRELRSHSWHTKSSTDLRWSASALSHVADLTQSPIAAFCCFQSPGSAYQQTFDCSFGSRAFTVASLQSWNDLPKEVTSTDHWQHFVASSRHTCSGNLFPEIFLDFLTTYWTSTDLFPVDLAVVLLLRPPKKFLDWFVELSIRNIFCKYAGNSLCLNFLSNSFCSHLNFIFKEPCYENTPKPPQSDHDN